MAEKLITFKTPERFLQRDTAGPLECRAEYQAHDASDVVAIGLLVLPADGDSRGALFRSMAQLLGEFSLLEKETGKPAIIGTHHIGEDIAALLNPKKKAIDSGLITSFPSPNVIKIGEPRPGVSTGTYRFVAPSKEQEYDMAIMVGSCNRADTIGHLILPLSLSLNLFHNQPESIFNRLASDIRAILDKIGKG